MTHTVIRLAELTEDTANPLGYSPTGNQLLLTGTDQNPLGGRVFTGPVVRHAEDDEDTQAVATAEQLKALRCEENEGTPSGLVVDRVHGEVQLPADVETLRWLLGVGDGVISVDVWQGVPDVMEVPAWHHSTVRLLRLRGLFVSLTGDVIKHEVPAEERAEGDGFAVSTWYQHQRWTTSPPPTSADVAVM